MSFRVARISVLRLQQRTLLLGSDLSFRLSEIRLLRYYRLYSFFWKRGRPRKTWMEGIQAAMTTRNIATNQWRNREEWRLVSGRRRQLVIKPDGWCIINLSFSPVLHCAPHDLPHVSARFIINKFQPKEYLSLGAKNANRIANPLVREKWNTFLMYRPNSASGSFSELPLIPKAQDAMTSVVNLAIVSFTSTGDPVNSVRWNAC